MREGGTASRSLTQDAGLHVGALSSTSSVGGAGEGKGNLLLSSGLSEVREGIQSHGYRSSQRSAMAGQDG